MKVNIRDKFPLCRSCSHSTITEFGDGNIMMYCSVIGKYLKDVPTQCTGWEFFGDDEPWSMTKKAWVLEVKGKQFIGFKPPKKGDTY